MRKIVSYQYGPTAAFESYIFNREYSNTIDEEYVTGVSLTHGQSPRQHIWTFVSACSDNAPANLYPNICPCSKYEAFRLPYNYPLPPWMGEDYFCDSGNESPTNYYINQLLADDPLWDGQGCGGNSTCCSFNNPPWFCKQLPQPTTDDIELRLCSSPDGNSAGDRSYTPLENVQIFVQ